MTCPGLEGCHLHPQALCHGGQNGCSCKDASPNHCPDTAQEPVSHKVLESRAWDWLVWRSWQDLHKAHRSLAEWRQATLAMIENWSPYFRYSVELISAQPCDVSPPKELRIIPSWTRQTSRAAGYVWYTHNDGGWPRHDEQVDFQALCNIQVRTRSFKTLALLLYLLCITGETDSKLWLQKQKPWY